MSLMNLYDQHDREKVSFEALRNKVWQDIKDKHANLLAAFQKAENLPEGYSKQMDEEINTFNADWSIPNGKHYKSMIRQHEQQIDAITRSFEPANNIAQSKDYTPSFIDKLASSKKFSKEIDLDTKEIHKKDNMDRLSDFEKNKDDMDLDQL